MELIAESKIDDEFDGWDDDNYYCLANGQVWQQSRYKYHYHYAYRPDARVFRDGASYFLEVKGMNEMVEVRRVSSPVFIYDRSGNPVGFWKNGYIYDRHGSPIGQLHGTHVYKLSGQYVGELYKDMVVNKHLLRARISRAGRPGNVGNPGNPGRRGSVSVGFNDVFDKLFE